MLEYIYCCLKHQDLYYSLLVSQFVRHILHCQTGYKTNYTHRKMLDSALRKETFCMLSDKVQDHTILSEFIAIVCKMYWNVWNVTYTKYEAILSLFCWAVMI